MTKHVPSLEAIRSKKEAFLASAAKYEALASPAWAEAADYEAAERVWLLLAPEDTLDDEAEECHVCGQTFHYELSETVVGPLGARYDRRVPSETADSNWQKLPSELLYLIQTKHWPQAQSSDVGSTAWRMWKDGRLIRPETGRYALPRPQISRGSSVRGSGMMNAA